MFQENDVVRLVRGVATDSSTRWPGIPSTALVAGSVGTVVMVLGDGEAYEVEFVAEDGMTLGLLTLTDSDLESVP
jgi:hypothetical protein